MGEYAEREIERFIGSFNGTRSSKKQIQQPCHNIPKEGLTWRQRRNLKTKARKNRQKERINEAKLTAVT